MKLGGQCFAVAFLFVTLLAVGLQCDETERQDRRGRRNQRRLRSHRVRHAQGPRPTGPTPPKSARDDSDAMRVITPWPVDPNNPYDFRIETVPENTEEETQTDEINKTVFEDPQDNDTTNNDTSEASPTLSTYQWHTRLRSKQARLFRIQMQILKKLGLRRQPNITSATIPSSLPFLEHLPRTSEPDDEDPNNYDDDDTVDRLQFLRPTCNLPRRADNTWNDENSFRLLFRLSSYTNNPNIRITSALLRLFKKSIPGCNCQSNGSPGSRQRRPRNGGRRRRQGEAHVEEEDTEKIRITVFRYTKPVRSGKRERKTLVDSIMVQKSAEGWQALDIRDAVTAWIKNPHNNFGLLVQVENLDQNELDATQIFATMNCSANASLPMIPLNPDLMQDSILLPGNNQSSPYLELMSTQSFASRSRRAVSAPSPCQLKHKMISLYDFGVKSVSTDEQIKIGYCEGSCGPQSSCRASAWENKIVTESNPDTTGDVSVYKKLSATSCKCHQGSHT